MALSLSHIKKYNFARVDCSYFYSCFLSGWRAVRITIMAELLGSDSGIGFSLALARINIDTAKVFAWTIVSIMIIIIIDHSSSTH
ncbi:hypothetical protein KHA80_14980 [Anaerobacillus sp. HL2]|nr:hypothetical protein KHA80_14980 [Anaerobacillus sp. HL2]